MKYINLILILFLTKTCLSQDSISSSNYNSIIRNIKANYEIYKGSRFLNESKLRYANGDVQYYFVDYVIENYVKKPITGNMISNRFDLYKLHVSARNSEYVLFLDSIDDVSIKLSCESVPSLSQDLMIVLNEYISSDTLETILTKNYKVPYGFNSSALNNSILDSINMQVNNIKFATPDSAISDLFLPNFTDKILHISPIDAYYSKDMNCIYLYVFGYYYTTDNQIVSYMAKLIYSLTSGYLGRIVANEDELNGFNCEYDGFIGF